MCAAGCHRPPGGTATASEPFLMLKENRFAYTALESLSGSERLAGAKLAYIFGPSGTGKSHLVRQFVRNQLRANPRVQIAHATGSEFAAELAEASANKSVHRFQARYRDIDILVCEDIGSLQGRWESQQQLLFAVDDTLAAGGRAILTARQSPGALSHVLPKLVNRCHAAVCAPVSPPDYDSRLRLLEHFARSRQVPLPHTAAETLARQLVAAPRELLATVLQLDELARYKRAKLDCDFTQKYLGEAVQSATPELSEITRTVARYFAVSTDELRGHSRRQSIVFPRQCAILLARELAQLSLGRIADHFGCRHHSSISHACQRARDRAAADPAAKQHLLQLEQLIRQQTRPARG